MLFAAYASVARDLILSISRRKSELLSTYLATLVLIISPTGLTREMLMRNCLKEVDSGK